MYLAVSSLLASRIGGALIVRVPGSDLSAAPGHYGRNRRMPALSSV